MPHVGRRGPASILQLRTGLMKVTLVHRGNQRVQAARENNDNESNQGCARMKLGPAIDQQPGLRDVAAEFSGGS